MSAEAYNNSAYPAIVRGREGKMNGQIIRYLALNGPSLIYSVAKDLASRSQTKVHYPTVNRRMHDLLGRQYVQKAGKRTTKAGVPADLYATTIRGEFAALAGVPTSDGEFKGELSPKEILRLIATASAREGSPFALIQHVLEAGQSGTDLVNKELLPEITTCVRNGYLNLDALSDDVICSSFASLVARRITAVRSNLAQDHSASSKEKLQHYFDILMRSLEKTMALHDHAEVHYPGDVNSDQLYQQGLKIMPISRQWGNELKVFLKLPSTWFE